MIATTPIQYQKSLVKSGTSVLEPRTSTTIKVFSHFTCLGTTMIGLLSVFTLTEPANYLKIWAQSLFVQKYLFRTFYRTHINSLADIKNNHLI